MFYGDIWIMIFGSYNYPETKQPNAACSGGSKNFGGRQFIISVLIYRKYAQRNISLLHGKSGFLLKKYEPIGLPPLY